MGNKKKIGKSRRDKFYQLAKETGYRARSAFKLIQLNRKFEFLQKSRVVVDLCAAPGGWLQVARENTPLSSVIIGVDLVPIKSIPNVITLVDDITTEKCRQDIKKELQTWKADCVLHDGAPNVGKNWLHDAFQQIQLTLQALKLATDILRKGGWFVTKVFRSKDYNSLLWVLQQLFKNVHATKPQASRNESAEIFVVCQHYLAPDKIDPKFLNPKSVFKDVEADKKPAIDLIHPDKKKRQREGYPEGDYTLFHTLNASEFVSSENYLQLLSETSEVVLDDDFLKNHAATTKELKECLKDIKVLGKREIRLIINWRKKIKKELEAKNESKEGEETVNDKKDEDENDSDLEEAKLREKLAEVEGEERKALKRKIKKTRRERAKLQHKMDMKMVLPDDKLDLENEKELFELRNIKNKKHFEEVEAGDSSMLDQDALEWEDEDDDIVVPVKKRKVYEKGEKDYLDPNEPSSDEEMLLSDEDNNDDDSDIELEEAEGDEVNPLLFGRPGKKAKVDMWFSKDSFAGVEDDADEDAEIENMVKVYKEKGGNIRGINDENKDSEKEGKSKSKSDASPKGDSAYESDSNKNDDDDSESETDLDSDYDENELMRPSKKQTKQESKAAKKDGFEVAPQESNENLRLNPTGLAIGAAMVSSRKRRREVIESGYHKYMFNDENLPSWFVKDEQKHCKTNLPVTKGEIQEYRLKMKAVDANPIKKIAEANARKKKKMMRRLEKARKKAESINETEDITDKEKWQNIKQIYKKAGLLSKKKKEVAYVVAKKGGGKRVRRPRGVSGPFKVVDPRMKKDNRAQKNADKQSRKGRGKKGGKVNKRQPKKK